MRGHTVKARSCQEAPRFGNGAVSPNHRGFLQTLSSWCCPLATAPGQVGRPRQGETEKQEEVKVWSWSCFFCKAFTQLTEEYKWQKCRRVSRKTLCPERPAVHSKPFAKTLHILSYRARPSLHVYHVKREEGRRGLKKVGEGISHTFWAREW